VKNKLMQSLAIALLAGFTLTTAPISADADTPANYGSTLKMGQDIRRSSDPDYHCTLGPYVHMGSQMRGHYFITAGHCGGRSGEVMTTQDDHGNWIPLGVETISASGDFGIITVTDPKFWHLTADRPEYVIDPNKPEVTGWDLNLGRVTHVGSTVCHRGVGTGDYQACGMIDNENWHIDYLPVHDDRKFISVDGLVKVKGCANPGDSGGAVTTPKGIVVGILNAATSSGTCTPSNPEHAVFYYTPIKTIFKAFNLNAYPLSTSRVCALSTDTTYSVNGGTIFRGTDIWRGFGTPGTSIGPLSAWPVSTIYGGGYGLFATNAQTGDIYRWSVNGGNDISGATWNRIGGPGAEFAVTGDGLYGLTPDRGAIYRYTGTGSTWTRFSGPAEHIYGGGFGLLATGRLTGNVYNVLPDGMHRIGGPGAEFVVTEDSVYGLAPNRQAVYRYTGTGTTWTRIGGPTAHIYADGGGDQILATAPHTGDVYRYFATTGNWKRIGGPGGTFTITDDGVVYGLAPNRRSIWRYSGTGTSWTKVSRDDDIRTIVDCP
jgi:hypothetical protein